MRRLLWGRSARLDIDRIIDFYAQIDPALPNTLVDRIAGAPLILLDTPNIGTPIGGGLRKWPVRQRPFVLLYAVSSSDIQVRRVRHVAEDWRPTRKQ